MDNKKIKEFDIKKFIPKLQKSCFWLILIGFALLFVYSLIFCTPIGTLENVMDEPLGPISEGKIMNQILLDMFPINNILIVLSIFGVIFALGYKVTRTNIRGKYYISNFVYGFVSGIYSLVSAVLVLVFDIIYLNEYKALDFETINAKLISMVGESGTLDPNSSYIFIIGFILVVILLLASASILFITTYKMIKQNKEAKLELKGGII